MFIGRELEGEHGIGGKMEEPNFSKMNRSSPNIFKFDDFGVLLMELGTMTL
jgi:hypothetical protein